MSDRIVLINAGFNSAGVEGGVGLMPAALDRAHLHARLQKRHEVIREELSFPSSPPVRGSSGLLAEPSLVHMSHGLARRVAEAHRSSSVPVVIGGDCAVLLGVLIGARLAGSSIGLVFLDGHEDAWPPEASITGETADCELGIALGLHPGPPT